MSTNKGRNLGLRLDETDTHNLDLFERSTGIEATTLARNALRAALSYWKQNGSITFPLQLIELQSTATKHAVAGATTMSVPPVVGPKSIESIPSTADSESGTKKKKKNGTSR